MATFLVDASPAYPGDVYKTSTYPARDLDVWVHGPDGAVKIATEHPIGNKLLITVYDNPQPVRPYEACLYEE